MFSFELNSFPVCSETLDKTCWGEGPFAVHHHPTLSRGLEICQLISTHYEIYSPLIGKLPRQNMLFDLGSTPKGLSFLRTRIGTHRLSTSYPHIPPASVISGSAKSVGIYFCTHTWLLREEFEYTSPRQPIYHYWLSHSISMSRSTILQEGNCKRKNKIKNLIRSASKLIPII
jgi:hypothetical protein